MKSAPGGYVGAMQNIREVMTSNPVCVPGDTTLSDAARQMRDHDIGNVLVVDGDALKGLVTDRDLVVRALADGRGPDTPLSDVCSPDLVTLQPSDTAEDAIRLMSEHAVRRLPVVDGGRPVGIVSIGDLAVERDPTSTLADISAAPPNT